MRPRQTILEIFSTFLSFEDDKIQGWMTDGRLKRSMQKSLDAAQVKEASPKFWALYWHQNWQATSSPIATNHLAAYLQEVCYWSAQKMSLNLSGGQSIADFFQIATIKLNSILKGFNAHQGHDLKGYASFAFTNAIKDTLRQRQEVDVCTDWALLHKVSQKRLGESLQNLGVNAQTQAVYLLAWQCLKILHAPTELTGGRKLGTPEPDILRAIANLYNQERVTTLNPSAPAATGESIAQWLTTCGSAVRSYLYPAVVSASQPKPNTESEEFLDDFAFTFQDSLLTQAIEREDDTARTAQQIQLQKVLLKALIKVDAQSQKLLQMYYGQGLTQKEIAQKSDTKQYTISRRISSAKQLLLTALTEWTQSTLHQSIDTNVVSLMSIAIEEWLQAHYSPPDPLLANE